MTSPKHSQFMNIEQLKSLKANDLSSDQYSSQQNRDRADLGMSGPGVSDITVGQLSRDHPHYQFESSGGHYDFDRLHQDVANEGIKQPLHVDHAGGRLMNGHHRAVMAQETGHMFVPVSDKPTQGTSKYGALVREKRPTRTWEPIIQEHEAEHEAARTMDHGTLRGMIAGDDQGLLGGPSLQGTLFKDKGFNDRRTK